MLVVEQVVGTEPFEECALTKSVNFGIVVVPYLYEVGSLVEHYRA